MLGRPQNETLGLLRQSHTGDIGALSVMTEGGCPWLIEGARRPSEWESACFVPILGIRHLGDERMDGQCRMRWQSSGVRITRGHSATRTLPGPSRLLPTYTALAGVGSASISSLQCRGDKRVHDRYTGVWAQVNSLTNHSVGFVAGSGKEQHPTAAGILTHVLSVMTVAISCNLISPIEHRTSVHRYWTNHSVNV